MYLWQLDHVYPAITCASQPHPILVDLHYDHYQLDVVDNLIRSIKPNPQTDCTLGQAYFTVRSVLNALANVVQ